MNEGLSAMLSGSQGTVVVKLDIDGTHVVVVAVT